jgi:hypothetical protein
MRLLIHCFLCPLSLQITMEKLTSLSSSIHPDDKSRAMIYLRMLLFMGTTGRERPDLYDQLGPTCFAAYLDRILTFWAPDTPSDVLGLALHRHVLFVGLVRAKSQALPGTSSITAEYLRGALERVLLPLSPYFRFEHAEHALGTLNTLLVPFMTQLAAPPLAVCISFNHVTLRVHAVRVEFSGSLELDGAGVRDGGASFFSLRVALIPCA